MKKTIFPILFLLVFACKNEAPKTEAKSEAPTVALENSWVMSVGDAAKLPSKGTGTPAQQRMYEGIYAEKGRLGFSWHFFPGGTMTELRAQTFQEGKWSSADGNQTISIEFPGGKPAETVVVKYLAADSMHVSLGEGKNARDFGFKNDGARYDRPEQNPYHPVNNQWRIKPAAPETDEQLKARIKNHIEHLCLILEAARQHSMKIVSFRASPSFFRQYNGGVGLDKESQWQEGWVNCFYDLSDVKKAYKIAETVMTSNKNAPTDPKNQWDQNNLIILRNLQKSF